MTKYILILLFLFSRFTAAGQILQNPRLAALIKQGTDQMNNYHFEQAQQTFVQLEALLPAHPVVPLLKGLNLYWQYLPLPATHPQYPVFMAYMNRALHLSSQLLDKNEEDPEAVFFQLTARSLIMEQYSKQGETMKAVGEAKAAYDYLKQGFEMKEQYREFYLTSGLYDYFREAYPEAKPVYKPFAFFFQSGDKKKGIEQLIYAARNCSIVNTQAYLFLGHIYMSYENSPAQAMAYLQKLVGLYPRNLYYVTRYVETLVALRSYDKIAPYAKQLLQQNPKDKFALMAGHIFSGIVEEQKNKNYASAKTLYTNALAIANSYGELLNNYKAYAYVGLSRIYAYEQNHEKSKAYLKLAKDTAEYQLILAKN